MSVFRLRPIATCVFLLAGGPAWALGLGEARLKSGLGEPFIAEFEVLGAGGERVESSCFRLSPDPVNPDGLPVMSRGRTTVRTVEGRTSVVVTSRERINDPVVLLGVRVGCGYEITRDYRLAMPLAAVTPAKPAPETVHEAPVAAAAPVAEAPPEPGSQEWTTIEGESLASIASALYPGDPALQRRFILAARRANPGLMASGQVREHTPLALGTRLAVPDLRTLAVARPEAPPAARRATPRKAAATSPRPAAPAVANAVPSRDQAGDKLQVALSREDEALLERSRARPAVERSAPPAAEAPPAPASGVDAATDARMRDLEETVLRMRAELARLDEQIAQTEAQLAASPAPTAAAPAAPAPATAPSPVAAEAETWARWSLPALLGFAAAGLGLFAFSRRRSAAEEAEEADDSAMPELREPALAAPTTEPVRAPAPPSPAATAAVPLLSPAPAATPAMPQPLLPPLDVDLDVADTAAQLIQVDERQSALELAEIMLSFGRVKGAAAALEAYIESSPKEAVQPWLKLLEIYRRAGHRAEFEALSEKLHRTFNVSVLGWNEFDRQTEPRSLEEHEHIKQKLLETWGKPECLTYLNGLVTDNREGERRGFPLDVLDDILTLSAILEAEYGLKSDTLRTPAKAA